MDQEFTEQTFSGNIPSEKYYTAKMIRVGTFLGGPIATGYFIGQNYKAFGQRHRIGSSWLFAILATFLLALLVAFIPNNAGTNSSSFRYIIPLIYSWAALGLVNYLQGNLITEHVNAGGSNYSWGRVVLISLIGCVVTLAVLFSVLMVFYTISEQAA